MLKNIAVRDAARDYLKHAQTRSSTATTSSGLQPMKSAKLGALGFMGMMVDEQYGGSGMDTELCLGHGRNQQGRRLHSVCMSVSNSLIRYGLQAFGTEEQRKNTFLASARFSILPQRTK